MKNKILSFGIIAVIVILLSVTSVFASFADFTDEQADKQAEEQIKEQEKEHNITEVKSSDNYLSELQIEGYTLTPKFDKQTLEYSIQEEIKSSEIKIKAYANNNKAQINGTGNIKIEKDKNEYRVDVTAENGSVRTYIIKLNIAETTENRKEAEEEAEPEQKSKSESKNETSKIEEQVTAKIENENSQQEKEENTQSNEKVYIVIAGIIAILIILLVVSKNKKVKRIRKH